MLPQKERKKGLAVGWVAVLVMVVSCKNLNTGDANPSLSELPPDSISAIARDAYIYGYPIVENYRVIYQTSQDTSFSKFAPFNQFYHEEDVAGPRDTLFVAPNGDTPYSYAVFDLRKGPVVLTIPVFEKGRYFVFPLYDMYTHIIYSISSRTIGHGGGRFLLAATNWTGNVPPGIDTVLRSETDFVYTIVRTQLFSRQDLPRVHALQQQFGIQTLDAFIGEAGKTVSEPLNDVSMKPENPQTPPDLYFFTLLNACLRYCHPHPGETALLKRFAAIGIVPGKPFQPVDKKVQASMLAGIEQAKKKMLEKIPEVKYAAELFGTRDQLKNDYLARAVGAWVGIYANQVEEFMGLQGYESQSNGEPYDGHNLYTVTFKKDQFPPVGAFWSITVYTLPSRFMYANEIHRNVISSAMLNELHWNADSSLTIYLQHTRPKGLLARNWLPVPLGPFTMAFRTYLPGERIRNGDYHVPIPVLVGTTRKP